MTPVALPDRLTLAVVEDDGDVRAALARLLRAHGHDVSLFSSAEQFAASPPPVDCLILDVRLPGLSGFELREQMVADGRVPPIVFITGDGERFFGEAALESAPALHKPFGDDELLAAIREAVAAAHRQR
jgi:FixJ family two-component response regulator